ncbi:probable CoA ligase CCL6 isoform X4 [Rosa rugosa]|uniref:probable CoA ligase CCL6 isoform X4 n=1 Tax=Rosa rugosa TaxID=74645 RepID=UPI002B4027FE|nr:probable CoA ligase CCL6 isoform X4 [Rosa rugosa]
MCGLHIKRCMMQPFVWVQPSGSAIRSHGVNPACDSHAITYVPLHDTLVEFIINRAEVSIAFVQENKIPAIISILPNCSTHLKKGSRRTGGILLFVGGIPSVGKFRF